MIHECGTLGDCGPQALIHSMWMVCTLHVGMRTGQEAYNLRWGNVQLKEDAQGEYLVYDTERQTKTRTGNNIRDTRLSKPRAYAIPEQQKDPVHLYKMYMNKRPVEMNDPESPFFLSVANKSPNHVQEVWYKKQAMGINKLYGIMKEMKEAADIKTDKRITPYSARKHLMQKLNDEGIPAHQIMQISGHKNVNSLNNYSTINPQQSRTISNILASNTTGNSIQPFQANRPPVVNHKECIPLPATLKRCDGIEKQQMFSNTTFNGPVTFNFDSRSTSTMNAVSNSQYNAGSQSHEQSSPVCSPPPRVWKRIRCISSSDSE